MYTFVYESHSQSISQTKLKRQDLVQDKITIYC